MLYLPNLSPQEIRNAPILPTRFLLAERRVRDLLSNMVHVHGEAQTQKRQVLVLNPVKLQMRTAQRGVLPELNPLFFPYVLLQLIFL